MGVTGARCVLDVPSGVLGEAQTFAINEQNTEDEDKLDVTVTYRCGSHAGTIVTKTRKDEWTWIPPIELAEENPTGDYVYITLSATTYYGSTTIGTWSTDVFYSIPSSVAPTLTVDITDESGYKENYGYFLQNLSRLKIKVNATEAYGASIMSYKIDVDNQIFITPEAVTNIITSSGYIYVYVYVQDSRGRTTHESFKIYFCEYSPPTVRSLTVKRCDNDGTENDQGEYVQVKYTAEAHPLRDSSDTAMNTVSYKLEFKESTASSFDTVDLTSFKDVFSISNETYIFAADTGSSYNVQLTVTDSFQAVVKTTIASTAATIMHFKADGLGIGLGKVSEVERAVDVGWMMQMNFNRITKLGDPEEDDDAVHKGYVKAYVTDRISPIPLTIYPVGAIYITADPTSPASLFGGTWERIQDVFLLAAGSTYTAGNTGGAATHTLTEDEMPSHEHWGVRRANSDLYGSYSSGASSGSSDTEYCTDSAGGNQPHNNMPPFLVVYVWKRVA